MRRGWKHRVKVARSDQPSSEGVISNVPGNYYDKHGARNPLVRRLMRRFHSVVLGQIAATGAESVLDVGCGEGHTSSTVAGLEGVSVVGVELEESALREASSAHPDLATVCGSTYELPFRSG